MIDTAWEPQGVNRAVPGDLERDGSVLAECESLCVFKQVANVSALAFLNGLQERDPNLRWDVDQALEHCEKVSDSLRKYETDTAVVLCNRSLLQRPGPQASGRITPPGPSGSNQPQPSAHSHR